MPTPETFDGYKRTTFSFNEGWKDDDEYEHAGKFRILKIRRVAETDTGNGEAEGRNYTVAAPRGTSKAGVINVLQGAFTRHCRCEHDCCGHLLTGVSSIRRIKRREWLVEVARRYNV